jgi:predicted nucleic acid-binding protein
MAKVFWDTNLFIYLLEGENQLSLSVQNLRRRMLQRNDRLYTSAMTVGEILVKPLASGNARLADRYRTFFSSQNMTVCSFDLGAADAYARIRQDKTIQPADAIQLACAASSEVDLFITNDDRLSQKIVSGIQFVTNLGRAPI